MQTTQEEVHTLMERIHVTATVWTTNSVRLVTHSALRVEEVKLLVKKLRYVIENELENSLDLK